MDPDGWSQRLPDLYAAWMLDLLGGEIPRETRATCDACVMQAEPADGETNRLYFFDPAVKCCTYVPELHNFLVGQILADSDRAAERGRSTVDKRIADGVGVTPLGLLQPPVFTLLYGSSTSSFGRSRTLRCPHYLEDDGGQCGIWKHRDSTCVTWFCKHVRGEVGYTFWRESLHSLLQLVERDLSKWCALELGAADDMLRHLVDSGGWTGTADRVTGDSIDHRPSPREYADMWGAWRGRERAWFIRCAELVAPLSWQDVQAICGQDVRTFAQLTERAYRDLLSEDIPSRLTVAPLHLVKIERGTSRLQSYSEFDPIDVPAALMEALPLLDGRPTKEAVAEIETELGLRLEPALVRKLVDFGVLIEPE